MDNEVEKISIAQFTEEGRRNVEDVFAREFPLTIILNDQELATLLCSPQDLGYLAVGFLYSEGLLESKNEIKKILVDDKRGVVRLETVRDKGFQDTLFKKVIISSASGKGSSLYNAADAATQKVESPMKISAGEVSALVEQFQHGSQLYLATGCVHSAALCDTENILVFTEDIGRHNAIDKVFGKCLLEDIPTDERVVITSGRISSEVLRKVARKRIPIIISISVPTNLGVRIADDLGITLVSSVRGKRMNVCANGWRVTTGGR